MKQIWWFKKDCSGHLTSIFHGEVVKETLKVYHFEPYTEDTGYNRKINKSEWQCFENKVECLEKYIDCLVERRDYWDQRIDSETERINNLKQKEL
jgi:hypothetical protein